MNTISCPFCGKVPEFKGEPEERDDGRYFVHRLPCGCHDAEVFAGTWRTRRNVKQDGGDWLQVSKQIAYEEWEKSFLTS